MNKLEELYDLANINNIDIHFFDLKHLNLLGVNIEKEELPHMIFLDHSLKQNNKLHLEILAHELGHYFSTIGNNIDNSYNYRCKLNQNKIENKANRWAYEYLICEKELIKAINKNITTLTDLADYFEVSIEFFIKRLKYLALKKQMLKLDKNRYLILTNLPSLYIYEDIGGHHVD